jgi:methyltransferase (TIGR00027 family)
MNDAQPSSTARGAAMLRAAHQILDDPRVLEDPFAVPILGAEGGAELRSALESLQSPERRGLRAFIAVRSRYAEDRLAEAVGRGARQYVILGAGLDTFAYRNAGAHAPLRVFEVDHPATQAWKRSLLREANFSAPDSLTFVPVDFERETLAAALDGAGFDRRQVTFFSWLGVTVYLTRDSVMRTLEHVASFVPPQSEIVFSYVARRSPIADRTAAMGEPWVTFFEPSSLAAALRRIGFSEVEDLAPEEVNRRYFANRSDGLRVGATGRLIRATVAKGRS